MNLIECLICNKKLCHKCYNIFYNYIAKGIVITGNVTDSHHLYCSDICSVEDCTNKGVFYNLNGKKINFLCMDHHLKNKYKKLYRRHQESNYELVLIDQETKMIDDLLKHLKFLNH